MRALMAYSWPGNVRQLENTVERALAFSRDGRRSTSPISAPEIVEPRGGAGDGRVLAAGRGLDFERYIGGLELAMIRRSLERTHGNKRQAAKLLNLKRTTLVEKLKRLEPRVDDSASKLS